MFADNWMFGTGVKTIVQAALSFHPCLYRQLFLPARNVASISPVPVRLSGICLQTDTESVNLECYQIHV